MRSTYTAEVNVDNKTKLVLMLLRTTNKKLVEQQLRQRYSWAHHVELIALIPDIAPVRPLIKSIAFA